LVFLNHVGWNTVCAGLIFLVPILRETRPSLLKLPLRKRKRYCLVSIGHRCKTLHSLHGMQAYRIALGIHNHRNKAVLPN
jgi:hypothetical protein